MHTLDLQQRKETLAKNIGITNLEALKHKGTGPFGKGEAFEFSGRTVYAMTNDEIREASRDFERLANHPETKIAGTQDGLVCPVDSATDR